MPGALVNGTELFYLTIGSGPPCLVMHGGLGFDHTYLHPWLDSLGNSLRLIYLRSSWKRTIQWRWCRNPNLRAIGR